MLSNFVFGISLFYLFVVLSISYFGVRGIPSFPKVELKSFNEEEEVSIIVPAKNESDTIERALDSLVNLEYKKNEIIVVVGPSDDNTREIVERYPVKIIDEPRKPEDWVGKNWACYNGFLASKGSILLFTDGDVVHSKKALSSALAFMKENNADALSCWPKTVVRCLSESFFLPIGYFLLSLGISTVVRAKTNYGFAVKGANGQFILVKRDAYEKVGTHYSVKKEILEDAALGIKLVESGFKLINANGEKILAVFPYSSFSEFKLAFERFGGVIFKSATVLAGVVFLHVIYFFLPVVLLLISLIFTGISMLTFLFLICFLTSFLPIAYFYSKISKLRFCFGSFLSSLIVCFIYIRGYRKFRLSYISWKGTKYSLTS